MPDATYRMRAPNGMTYQVDGPAGATDDQVRMEIMRQHPDAGGPVATKPDDKFDQMRAPLEVLGTMGRGMVAKPAGDIAGFAAMLASYLGGNTAQEGGGDPGGGGSPADRPMEVKNAVQAAIQGEGPQSNTAKGILKVLGYPGVLLDKGGQAIENVVAPASPDVPENDPGRMIARGLHETVNAAPMFLGAGAPKVATPIAGALERRAVDTMMSAAKPSKAMRDSGDAERGVRDILETGGISATRSGADKLHASIDRLDSDLAQTIATSDARIAAPAAAVRTVSDVLERWRTNIHATDALPTIQKQLDKFLAHPLLVEPVRAAERGLTAAEDNLAGITDTRNAAARNAAESQHNAVTQAAYADNHFPVPGMPRVPARLTTPAVNAPLAAADAEQFSGIARAKTTQDIPAAQQAVAEAQQTLADAGKTISIQDAQAIKQSAYRNLGDAGYQPGLKPEVKRDTTKAIARGLKEDIAAAEPSVSILNAELSKQINMLDTIEAGVLRDANKNPIGLGALIRHPWMFAVWMADRSPAFKSIVARMEFNVAKGLRATGDTAAPTAATALSDSAAPPRTINPYPQLPSGLPQQQTLRDLSTFKALPAP